VCRAAVYGSTFLSRPEEEEGGEDKAEKGTETVRLVDQVPREAATRAPEPAREVLALAAAAPAAAKIQWYG